MTTSDPTPLRSAPPSGRRPTRGHGSVYRRCGCRAPDGRQLGRNCPALTAGGHGTWTFDIWLPGGVGTGKARRLRRGGYPTRAQADKARKALVRAPATRQRAAAWTTGAWLRHWLAAEQRWRPSTLRGYTSHVHLYLDPYLGRIPLDELTPRHVQAMFDALATRTGAHGRRLCPTTLVRLQATLRAALNAAIRAGLLTSNPSRWLRLPPHPHVRAEVWTPGRVAVWRATGEHPIAAVWTLEQLAAFLDQRSAARDPLLTMWRVIALRGLRRGEAC